MLPGVDLKLDWKTATMLNMENKMKDHKLAGLSTLKNFKETNAGTLTVFSSYL